MLQHNWPAEERHYIISLVQHCPKAGGVTLHRELLVEG
jgi:hypothetical protein